MAAVVHCLVMVVLAGLNSRQFLEGPRYIIDLSRKTYNLHPEWTLV